MTHADRLLRTPATFRRLTGLTPTAFRRLLGEVAAADEPARTRRAGRPGRQRKAGGGRKPALPLVDPLLMLLVYYRTYVPHTFLGFLFGLDDSNVSRSNRRLEPLPAGIFRIPERKVALTPEEIKELFFGSTERPTCRPVRGQRRYYSGKKRRHTLKTQVVVVRVRKRPGRGGDAAGGDRVRGRRVPRDRVEDPTAEAAEGPVDRPPAGREPAGRAEADRGRARDREVEGVAGRRRAVAEPPPPPHADDEERRRASQPDVRGVRPPARRWPDRLPAIAEPNSQRV